MTLVQITHNDLDGYGASTVAASLAPVSRVVHVARYSDVGPVVEDELKRLRKASAPETLLMTDLGLEEPAIAFFRRFVAMNRSRDEGARHRLVVLDHHASSLDQLRRQNLEPAPDTERPGLIRTDLGDPNVYVLIDEAHCATRMAFDQRALYAPEGAEGPAELATLIEAVEALDLWQKTSPAFTGGLALDEMFWDSVSPLVPPSHPRHDRFLSDLLLAAARCLAEGATAAELERRATGLRAGIVDALLADEPGDDPALTTRMRLARMLARSDVLFHPLSDGTLLSFGLDSGTFQRVSDLVMEGGRAKRVVNVQRAGTLSFRSIDGTALDGARAFRGGGHRDAAGGKLPQGSAHSLADAVAQVEPVLNPPAPDPSASPFGALKNWKG
ncbi:dimethylmenaquinone methyltransferase [Methylorubrum salsuginis]|uniref:Oligoribonuclease NrnB or cAMP/cGMP phosphodiesterase, DHH superfamily n=1 Tax=Methylorubrum salsuginis TaxID=414703 RepID=A0A1I4JTZ8_9HYPH|nr:dimethylmenaquinone methyltransferase [Methylorubrum salsuginis]SFL70012.1 Oligoribonuclease NrnB or cAMP/cGMP phosphodiesterase, DHH superfamily [Methylorubrum salsuginis]